MNKSWTRMVLAAVGLALAAGFSWANNLSITNVRVRGRDASTAIVRFDISWENSWRYASEGDPLYFHDAAWVFFKVLPDGQTAWQHVMLEGTGTNPPGFAVGSGTPIEIVVPPDRVGMLVRRAGDGAGVTSVQNVEAVWNFASNGLAKSDMVKLQAFGVEMVYVAEGPFMVGDGASTGIAGHFEAGTSGAPFAITNQAYAITLGGGAEEWRLGNHNGSGMYQSVEDFNYVTSQTLPAAFPKGYAAFYCMKYEITEGQWVDFFNTLTDNQKTTRDFTSSAGGGKNSDGVVSRNTVAWTHGDATTARPDRACSYLSWADLCAFADWAGLRPMTELEFEKACRGPLTPVAGEYAWGSATIMTATRVISGVEDGTETITSDTSAGGCNYGGTAHTGGDGGVGPLRAGIFATNGAIRASAGASYWGIMELSGNLLERTVSVGNATSRQFDGQHGDGKLTATGDANVSNWPNWSGLRGGSFSSYHITNTRVSDRLLAAYSHPRDASIGGRAVRTAP